MCEDCLEIDSNKPRLKNHFGDNQGNLNTGYLLILRNCCQFFRCDNGIVVMFLSNSLSFKETNKYSWMK